MQNNLSTPQEAPAVGRDLGVQMAAGQDEPLVTLESQTVGAAEEQVTGFDALALLAPAMAIFFLMYTVTYGGRSLLDERSDWTLQRLLTTPTDLTYVLGGKVIGIFLTGFVQLMILIFGTTLLFGFDWGDPLAVLVLIVATVLGATGWGLILAAVARTPNQVSSVGTAMMLLFGILGGSFLPAAAFPGALQSLRRLFTTPATTATFLLGTISSQILIALVQMLILVGFGIFVLNLNWGQSPGALLVMLTTFALAAVAFGTMLGTFITSESQANGLSIMMGMAMALLGGCWYPLELFPPQVQTAVHVFPTTWAMRGLTDLVARGGGLAQILLEAAVLLGFAALFFVVGTSRFRYE